MINFTCVHISTFDLTIQVDYLLKIYKIQILNLSVCHNDDELICIHLTVERMNQINHKDDDNQIFGRFSYVRRKSNFRF